ncbi:Reverse transcriptase (RNA-dependent DNA polymerase), partial [Phytophthora infestans]
GKEKEMNSMFEEGVFELIDESKMPRAAHLLDTTEDRRRRLFSRWRSRLHKRGDFQKFGVDYCIMLSPVARMMTFRAVVAIAAKLRLEPYQGDINTAYRNAELKIKQYLQFSVEASRVSLSSMCVKSLISRAHLERSIA